MKIKFSQLFTHVAILVVTHVSFPMFAQEEESLPYELQDVNNQELNINNEDKALIYEHDVKSEKISPSESQQSAVQVSSKSKNSESSKASSTQNNSSVKEGDDAMSFNFLYYIIQKYKFSDIVDQ